MGFKTKWNRFWTLRGSDGGFTLVELVVVIAILAILAGVAVPAYTGYIKKAREAGDQMLIGVVNTSFASACFETGVELANVSDARISVSEQLVFGISSVTTNPAITTAELDQISSTFNFLFADNFNTPFATENVKSLYWVPEEASFKMDHVNSVASRIVLSSGKSITISADDMAKIQASAYADMGYTEVAAIINDLGDSTETLASVAKTFGLMGKFTAVMAANGLVDDATEAESMSAAEAANGLQMVTAKYLANATDEEISYLLNEVELTSSTSMLKGIAGDAGGTRTVAAAALQYALVEAFASSDASSETTITWTERQVTSSYPFYKETTYTDSVSNFLASDYASDDPIKAMAMVQSTSGYTTYTSSEQYTSDVNGFVGTMSILGDNIGTTSNPGSIDIDAYFQNGVNSQDAADALTAVLGK